MPNRIPTYLSRYPNIIYNIIIEPATLSPGREMHKRATRDRNFIIVI